MPSSLTPGSSDIACVQFTRCRRGLRRDPSGSALPTLPQSVSRGARLSRLHWFAFATACQVARPPGRIGPGFPGPPGTFTSRLPAGRSPFPPLDMTTTATGLLCWRDFHPQEWQLASLHRIQPTTPFGRRPLSLAMVAAQAAAKACPETATAHKWRVFRNLTEAKDRLGLSDRALAVLSALLTFHPDTALMPGEDTVVFPSNRELSVRAHGPAPATLRRALAQLVAGGLVIRRDSPNGKRFARKGEGGAIEQAFGFDLTPLVARAAEFERLAGEVRAEARARHLLREEISLHRRDIAKTIATAVEENLPGPWGNLAERFRQLGGMPPRSAGAELLEVLACDLRALRF